MADILDSDKTHMLVFTLQGESRQTEMVKDG